MATLGEELKDVEARKTRERIDRRSEMLRKFVKQDLLEALRENIHQGNNGYAPLIAPVEIRPLFAAPVYEGYTTPYTNKNSAYYNVWRELDAWAAGENLKLNVGVRVEDKDYKHKYSTSWDHLNWGANLSIKVEEPVRPTPPPTQKMARGANFDLTDFVGAGCIALLILLMYFFIHR